MRTKQKTFNVGDLLVTTEQTFVVLDDEAEHRYYSKTCWVDSGVFFVVVDRQELSLSVHNVRNAFTLKLMCDGRVYTRVCLIDQEVPFELISSIVDESAKDDER